MAENSSVFMAAGASIILIQRAAQAHDFDIRKSVARNRLIVSIHAADYAHCGNTMDVQQIEIGGHTRDLDRMVGHAKRASNFLKAVAHENRLMILCILAEGEKSVGELEQMLSLRQPTVSQQLARLRAEGLVSTRRNGKIVYYSLASSDVRMLIGAMYDVFCRKAFRR